MKTKTKFTALILAAVLFAGIAASQQQQSSTNERFTNLQATFINSDPVPLQSGESGDINFKIRNTGNAPAGDVRVELVNHFPFEVKPDRRTEYSLGTLTRGEEYHISTEVLVADDAPDGSNNFRIRITNGDFSRTVNVPVEIQSEDIDLDLANLKTEPQQLRPDTDNNLMTVDVVNNGEKTAKNTVVDLELPDYFERTSSFSTRQALGNVQEGQVKTGELNFDLARDAPSGSTTIDGEITYTAGDSSSQITEPVSFDVHIEGRPQFEVTDLESELQAGSTKELRLEVENIGDKKASSTRIRALDSADQPFSYDSSSQYVGTLDPNQTGEAVFQIDTDSDASAKDYLIDFETRGVQGTEVFVEDTTVQASVNGRETSNLPLVIAAVLVLAVLGGAYRYRDRIEAKIGSEE